MAFALPSRVYESFTTTGTGTITLGGAVAGFRTFASALSNGDTVFYFLEGGSDWEIGYGTYTGGTLARTTVLKSSNSNNAVSWAAGTKYAGIAPLGMSDLDATNLGRLQGALGISSFVQTLLNDADAAAFLTTLSISAFVQTLLDDASATAFLTTLGIEAGTFTPTVTLATPGTFSASYANQQGNYIKIANYYIVLSRLTFTPTIGTGSGEVRLGGLPATVLSSRNGRGFVTSLSSTGWAWPASSTMVGVEIAANTTYARLYGGASGVSTAFAVGNLTGAASHDIGWAGVFLT